MTAVLVSGALANKHGQGGAAWTRLNWLLGFRRLGFDVHFVEQIGCASCVDASGAMAPFESSENLKYFRAVVDEFGLSDSATLVYEDGDQTEGRSFGELIDLADTSAFLINISGHLTLERLKRRARCRVYVDLDPGFTQFWEASGHRGARLQGHDYYFTVGENIGTPACSIPDAGVEWRPVRQPVVLDLWPPCPAPAPDRFTTISTWRGPYGPVEYGGRRFGLKVHEFRKYLALPECVDATFEVALDIHEAEKPDREALAAHRWHIVDPRHVVSRPSSFRRYVQESAAEFSVAQGVYVETNSGWFSDRTVRYLASGRPALVQDTGFSRNLPVGSGLMPFRTFDEAVDGAKRILSDYEAHCRAARQLAEEYFDSDTVLSRLVDAISDRRAARASWSSRNADPVDSKGA